MAYQRYSIKEALNRFYRLWSGNTPPSDAPNSLPGEVFSEDEAWSNIAELFGGSLPGTTLSLPDAVADAIGLNVEYGEIYNNSTGTAVVSLSTSWAKVTGSFQGNTQSSSNITPDYVNGRITINAVGVYFVGVQASFSGGANAFVEGAVYLGGIRQEPIRFRRRLSSVGDVGSASAIGIVIVTGTGVDLEFYARTDAGTPNFKLESGQLWTYGIPTD
jgi:hypothetical protein